MYSRRVLYSHNNIYPPGTGVLLFENVAVRTNTGKRFSQHKNNNHSDANKKITAKKNIRRKNVFRQIEIRVVVTFSTIFVDDIDDDILRVLVDIFFI